MQQVSPASSTPLHIFKPGQFTAMSGETHRFTPADLRAIAAAYNPQLHEAPLVVGHPATDMPAHGWVQGLQFQEADGDMPAGLYALPAQVNADFADMVAAGAYKKISAAFYGPAAPGNPTPGGYYLRHVGFLGAQPPAVKGLRNPSFGEAEAGVLCFSDALEDPTPSIPLPPAQESTVTAEEAAQLRAQNEQLAAQNAALQAAAEQAAASSRHAENLAFAEKLVAEGRLLSSAAPTVVATLNHLAALPAPVEFGEGEAKAPLLQALKDQLKAAPVMVAFGEAATTQRAAEGAGAGAGAAKPAGHENPAFAEGAESGRLAQHAQIVAYAAQHQLSYHEAANAVLK